MLLHETFDYSAREHAASDFAIHGARRLTYAEARAEIHRIAHALAAHGLAPGDRVAILSKNSIELVLLYYACSKAIFAPDALAAALARVRSELGAVKHFDAFVAGQPDTAPAHRPRIDGA